ncbi:hypothetical protein AN1666.2 [Aspergillus nidulans FGSC A4]|nr:hypothetical protein AN1666.2 [Aspergillus nidulans FGSC A4]|eukprot:XP_659270.1 hypothetical protein AN1666.2 [Aspergillus nidulans FGSC A4]
MANVRVKGENFYRDAKKVKRLNMLKDGKPQRDAAGNITVAASYQSREAPVARIEPNRKWFGNTRVISQEALSSFREAVAERASDPYQVLLKTNKLPMSLIRDNKTVNGLKQHEAKMTIETSPFSDTFGPKAQRKRVKLGVSSLEDLAGETMKMHDSYVEKSEQGRHEDGTPIVAGDDVATDLSVGTLPTSREAVFLKGQSKRIWNELYKVIDSSDVVIHVIDARDPEGTRCRGIEKYIREEAPHKHLIFVLNKCDLVPTGVAAAWISVGLIGYPNTGKSSIINTLRKKKVCTVAPIPGETKVWQYVTLMKRIYLIDCPGVVPPSQTDTPEDILLRGVVRVENVENPEQYIPAILKRVQPKHLERTYGIKETSDAIEFLSILARKGGRLLRGGEPDLDGVAKMVINDFLRGKIPWFTPPPFTPGEEGEKIEGREGRLGEMGRKRKIEETSQDASEGQEGQDQSASDSEEEFGGFDDEQDDSDNDSIANLEVSDEESGEE